MTQYTYVMKGLSKAYDSKIIFKDIYLSFFPGAKIGIIGYNGAGKSTLLRIMAGIDKDFIGEAWAADGVKIGYLEQEPKLNESKNVYENILEAVGEKKQLLDDFNNISAKFAEEMTDDLMNDLLTKQAELQDKIDSCNAWELDREIEMAMQALRCPAPDSDIKRLSGGEKRRVALCKLLLAKPDMLLLDEPTNHLDAESVSWLEHYLKNYAGTVVLITHDRYFLDNVTGWILELDRGAGIPWEGNYSSWLDQKSKRLAVEEKVESDRQKQLKMEYEWVKQSPKARQAKSKVRLADYEKLRDQQKAQAVGLAKIVIPDGPKLGNKVIVLNNLTKEFGDKTLMKDFSFTIPPAAIVGIIGPNGIGKTTLFKMITGVETPNSGTVEIGESVKLGFVDQSRDLLNNDRNVWEEISDGLEEIELGNAKVKSRAYVSSFNFKGPDQQKIVGALSGGERNRVHLAKMLKSGANVLLLDEPTNDLDVDTLRSLEDAISDFSGCVLVISHDRWFLDRLATHIIAFEEDNIICYEGNYQDYEIDMKKRHGISEEDSIKYRHRKFVN